MLWTKWWNSCLLKPPSPENTVRLSHKPGNKNNVKEEFICLIFSNKYSKLLLRLYWKKWLFKNKSGVEKLSDYSVGVVLLRCHLFVHIFQASNVTFKLLLANCFFFFYLSLAQNDYLTSGAIVQPCEIQDKEKWINHPAPYVPASLMCSRKSQAKATGKYHKYKAIHLGLI